MGHRPSGNYIVSMVNKGKIVGLWIGMRVGKHIGINDLADLDLRTFWFTHEKCTIKSEAV